ncbi:hypothetical protein [Pedobacter sp. Hv1]|uniref:hypothetical protein n=1 Tax=Pedobacter sp. Hv1 TaxID=1740090 RepID=UPI0006D88A90|nr:hypothetical protein [Pedobacter sp. Hv1]KQC01958.1 hypothetical protein AQF98_06235 [Pedobacter sp. Hv1]
MNKEENKKSEKPASNYLEPQPKGKVDKGDKAVKKAEDKRYKKDPAIIKDPNPAKRREESEQPVHPIKKEPTD